MNHPFTHAPGNTWKEDEIWSGSSLVGLLTPGGKRHYSLDHLGSPRVVTNDSGNLIGTQKFTPFGSGGSVDSGALHFTGHERDRATLGGGTVNLPDYAHARLLDTEAGRFLSVDPGKDSDPKQPQSWNLYAYVRNNPLGATDPTGRWIELSKKNNSNAVRNFLVNTVMRPTGRNLVQSVGQSTSYGVTLSDHRINPPVWVANPQLKPPYEPFRGGTFAPNWTHDSAGKVTGATGGTILIDSAFIAKLHQDSTGVTRTVHEFIHAVGAQQGLSPADLKGQDTSGSADAFGRAIALEQPDITRSEAEDLVDDLLSEEYRLEKPPK